MTDIRHNISEVKALKTRFHDNLLLRWSTWYGMDDSLHNNLQSPQSTDTAKTAQSPQYPQDWQYS
jgi:hypothetical protein